MAKIYTPAPILNSVLPAMANEHWRVRLESINFLSLLLLSHTKFAFGKFIDYILFIFSDFFHSSSNLFESVVVII